MGTKIDNNKTASSNELMDNSFADQIGDRLEDLNLKEKAQKVKDAAETGVDKTKRNLRAMGDSVVTTVEERPLTSMAAAFAVGAALSAGFSYWARQRK